MTPSHQCAECGGLGVSITYNWENGQPDWIVDPCCQCHATEKELENNIKRLLHLARSSAALLEAGEDAKESLEFAIRILSAESSIPEKARVEYTRPIEHSITELQTAIARAKEGGL